ncbi:MAG: trxA [Pedosphaera sp.]|nr:trxA [Pedosphaera sp.]
MKKLILSLLMLGTMFPLLAAEKAEWLTDLPKAKDQAKAENKLVLMDFTGSDWCGWCIKLDKEVFSTPEFAEYAKKNLVLVEVDFPNKKPQSAELKKANEALQEKYKIEGYPTVIVLNSEGKKVGELGYGDGGPKAFIAKLEKLQPKKK